MSALDKDKDNFFSDNEEDGDIDANDDFAVGNDLNAINNTGTDEVDFDDANEAKNTAEEDLTGETSKVHIRIQQRNARKRVTLVQNLPKDIDKKLFVKKLKKRLNANGCIKTFDTYGECITFQGDHRTEIHAFLTQYEIANKNSIQIHGY